MTRFHITRLLGLTAMLIATLAFAGLSGEFLERIEKRFGADARLRVDEWRELVVKNRQQPADIKLRIVNAFFNRLRFQSDNQTWGQQDYWATPVELLTIGAGDCEDFSIGKFFTLRELGIPNNRLRIMYVKALSLNQAHMVLTYYATPDAEPVVLDNLVPDIKPASARTDLMPMYSFNSESLWQAKERGQGERMGSSDGIPRWDEVNQRLRQELDEP